MPSRATRWAVAFLALPTLAYAIAVVGPTLYSFYYSFTDWHAVGGTAEWVGLEHYRHMIHDTYFWRAFKNTALWTAVAVVVPTAVGLALAVLLTRIRRLQRLVKSLFFLPIALSLVVVGQAWQWIYRGDDGLLNIVLRHVGLSGWQHDWLADPQTALWAVMVTWCWQQVSLSMVIFLAGLTSVPGELIEAAHLDGAGARQRFWHVTIPSLRPAFTVVISLSLVNALKNFDIVKVMTDAGPFKKTETLAYFVYRTGFTGAHDFGYSSAVSVVLFLITLIIVGLFMAWANRGEASR